MPTLHKSTYIHMQTHTYVHTHKLIHIHTLNIQTHTYTLHKHTYTNTYIHVHTNTYINTHTHKRTHTYTNTALLFVLASLMFACVLWMVYSELLLDCLVVSPSLAILGNSCGITFIDFQSVSVSFIGFLQLLGAVSLALLLLIFWSFLYPSSSCLGRRSLRSASRGDYLIPRSYTATKQNRAFLAAGPSI